jgi:hypothetical protein
VNFKRRLEALETQAAWDELHAEVDRLALEYEVSATEIMAEAAYLVELEAEFGPVAARERVAGEFGLTGEEFDQIEAAVVEARSMFGKEEATRVLTRLLGEKPWHPSTIVPSLGPLRGEA